MRAGKMRRGGEGESVEGLTKKNARGKHACGKPGSERKRRRENEDKNKKSRKRRGGNFLLSHWRGNVPTCISWRYCDSSSSSSPPVTDGFVR